MNQLETFLGLVSPSALEAEDRQQAVLERLAQGRVLLGLDNIETLVYARDGQDMERRKTALRLYAFFRKIPQSGTVLLLSSREESDLPGENSRSILRIGGLADEPGARLFYEFSNVKPASLLRSSYPRFETSWQTPLTPGAMNSATNPWKPVSIFPGGAWPPRSKMPW